MFGFIKKFVKDVMFSIMIVIVLVGVAYTFSKMKFVVTYHPPLHRVSNEYSTRTISDIDFDETEHEIEMDQNDNAR